MTDEVTWEVGTVTDQQATINGVTYGRVSQNPEIADGTSTIFLSIGRTPFAIAPGGYHAPG